MTITKVIDISAEWQINKGMINLKKLFSIRLTFFLKFRIKSYEHYFKIISPRALQLINYLTISRMFPNIFS